MSVIVIPGGAGGDGGETGAVAVKPWRYRTGTLKDWPIEVGYLTEVINIYVEELNAALEQGDRFVERADGERIVMAHPLHHFVDRWEAVFRTPYIKDQDGYSFSEYELLQRNCDWIELRRCCLANKSEATSKDRGICSHVRFMQSVGIIDQPRCPSLELLSPGPMLMAMSLSNRYKVPIGTALIRMCTAFGANPERGEGGGEGEPSASE